MKDIKIVIGANYGDEGKGLMTDYFCSQLLSENEKCCWTTPFDMIVNQIVEASRGDKRHGSCGVGIWETIVRSQMMHWNIKEAQKASDEQVKDWLKRFGIFICQKGLNIWE